MKKKRIWLLGTEGRMAAKARHLQNHEHVVYISGPGCPGTDEYALRIVHDLTKLDFDRMAQIYRAERHDLIIPGSEDLYAAGVVDQLTARGCRVFGPAKEPARLETSKWFSHRLMRINNVPCAYTVWFKNYDKALMWARLHFNMHPHLPIVVKPDGRTGGKGVTVAWDLAMAKQALIELMVDRKYKSAGEYVGLAEYLSGPECSVFVACDGNPNSARLVFVARDCKALRPAENGRRAGPMTGGVWSVSSIPEWTPNLEAEVMESIVRRTLTVLRKRGLLFRGMLYVSLKLTAGLDGKVEPKVVEFNVRFGDPETQAGLERLESDLAEILFATLEPGELPNLDIKLSDDVAGCLVLCAKDYPNNPELGKRIDGIRDAEALGVTVLEAGTRLENGELVTNGGRALNLVYKAKKLEDVQATLAAAASLIHFDGGKEVRVDVGNPLSAS
jgi:phosphoribosylamine--glycine ligase